MLWKHQRHLFTVWSIFQTVIWVNNECICSGLGCWGSSSISSDSECRFHFKLWTKRDKNLNCLWSTTMGKCKSLLLATVKWIEEDPVISFTRSSAIVAYGWNKCDEEHVFRLPLDWQTTGTRCLCVCHQWAAGRSIKENENNKHVVSGCLLTPTSGGVGGWDSWFCRCGVETSPASCRFIH